MCIELCILIYYLFKFIIFFLQYCCIVFAVLLQILCSDTALIIAVLLHKHCSDTACCVQCGCITVPVMLQQTGLPDYRQFVSSVFSCSRTFPYTPPPFSPVPKSGNAYPAWSGTRKLRQKLSLRNVARYVKRCNHGWFAFRIRIVPSGYFKRCEAHPSQ